MTILKPCHAIYRIGLDTRRLCRGLACGLVLSSGLCLAQDIAVSGVASTNGTTDSTDQKTSAGTSGTSSTDQKTPLARVTIILSPLSTIEKGADSFKPVRADTDAEGAFQVGSVPAGTYRLCAIGLAAQVLNPCEWAASSSVLELGGKISSKALDLRLTTGTTLHIAVADPNSLVPTPFQAVDGKFFRFGVWSSDGEYHAARYVSTDRKQHNYELVIPFDTDLKIWIDSVGLQVLDEKKVRADGVRGTVVRVDKNGKAASALKYQVMASE